MQVGIFGLRGGVWTLFQPPDRLLLSVKHLQQQVYHILVTSLVIHQTKTPKQKATLVSASHMFLLVQFSEDILE